MLLDTIDSPQDLKRLDLGQLKQLSGDLRERIIETIAKTGGHLGANLGSVEITVALHSVLDSPQDKIVWDVGHQAYSHKLLTGRREDFDTLRQYGGISGFPRMSESPFDAFGTGHAGTSISAALGYALARDRQGNDHTVAAVTGDGALTAGMAFEAFNHAGQLGTDLVVILNDNEMSISPNVGAMSEYLTRIRLDPTFNRAKEEIEWFMKRIPAIGTPMVKAAERLKDSVKHLLVPGRLFEELGFTYFGPVDGHNIQVLQRTLREAIGRGGPVVIHAVTQKGRGYKPAESHPEKLHGMKPVQKGAPATTSAPGYSQVFGQTLLKMAREDPKIVALTAAMPSGTGLDEYAKALPDQFLDVGIAEQHAVTLAAGLASGGMKPVAAIYSTFLQRGYDQVIHDVCIQNLPVTFAIDRAGLVGDDGPTHHGVFDLSFLRAVPNMTVMSPKDENELRHMLRTAVDLGGPAAVRFPRGKGVGAELAGPPQALPIGKAETLRTGKDVSILAIGPLVYRALQAAKDLANVGIEATVVNARFVKPLDEMLVCKLAQDCQRLVTVEENALMGGFGSAVLECLSDHGIQVPVVRIGIPDRFIEHGSVDLLHKNAHLTVDDIVAAVSGLVGVVQSQHAAAGGGD